MIRKFLLTALISLTILLVLSTESTSREWYDLHEDDGKLFGSEKELKYNPDMFFLQRESWEGHYSFMLFWLFKYTDYPKYSSTRFFPFYYGLNSKIDNRSLSFIPITLTYWETDGDEKFRINPLFLSGSGNYPSYHESFSFSLLHGYLYQKNKSEEIPEKTWWAPIIPLIYRDSGNSGGHMNFLWFLDYSWDRNSSGEENITRFWLMPLLFHRPGNNGYTNILPPLFLYNRHSSGEYWTSLFPVFVRSKEITYNWSSDPKNRNRYEDMTASLLHYSNDVYRGNWGGEIESTRIWFPLLPLLFYSYNEPGVESHRNLLCLIDWHNNAKNETDRFWFIPFLFHKPGNDGYTHSLPPIFLYNRHSNGEYWISLLPLFLRSKDKSYDFSYHPKESKSEKLNYIYEDLIISPLLFSYNERKDNWDGEKKSSYFWFPILPLLFYSYNEPGIESHKNLLCLIDWHNNAKNETDRFWFTPLYFGGDTYRHILPPLYISLFYSDDDYYRHLLPIFISSKSKSTVYDETGTNSITRNDRLFLTLLSGYSSVNCSEGGENLNSSAYWFPIIPLYYHSEDYTGSHTNLFWAFDWSRNSGGEINRFFFIPFIFHEAGEGGYRYYFPFFFRPGGWSAKEGVSYSPFYYHRWSETEDKKWSWLVHYKQSNNVTGEYLNTWMPLYYHHNIPSEGETTWVMPVYYHHDSLEHNGYFARIVAPFYWNFETDKRDTTIFLPLYFETTKKNGKGSFYLNILGWSKSVAAGVNPVIDAGLGFNKNGMYVDIDGSWLVDMFSFSTRVTVPIKNDQQREQLEEDDDAKAETQIKTGEVKLTKKKGADREESINYWGFHFFYGLLAYQKADTRWHFRLLPLSWITGDNASDNKMRWIVNYLSYKEDETEYFVFFPLYAYQREGKSHSTGYMLNAFWSEYDDELKMNEYTVLWPFFNMYSSPAKSGWRILPLVWHKNRIENDISYSSTITPLFMDWHDSRVTDDSTVYRLNFTPLHFYRYNEDNSEKSKLWFSMIPFIFYKYNEASTSYTIAQTQKDNLKKKNTPAESEKNTITSSDTVHWLFPLYYMNETGSTDTGRNISTTDYTLIGLPLLYYHSETEQTTDDDESARKKGSIFLMGYYNEFSSEYSSSNILFGLYKSESYPAKGDYMYKMFYGLFNISDMSGNYKNYFRPFYYYGNDNGKWESSVLLGLWRMSGEKTTGDSGFSLLYNVYNTSLTHYQTYGGNGSIPVEERETWFAPIFYYSDTNSTDTSNNYSRNETFTLLHYRDRETLANEERYTFWAPILPLFYYSSTESLYSGEKSDDTLSISLLYYTHKSKSSSEETFSFWAPVLPLVYYSTDNESTHINFLWLADYEKGRSNDFTRFWLLPTIFSKTGDNGYFHIAPLYMSWWNNSENDYSYLICGLYLHNSPDYSRQNFLYLYDHKSYARLNHDDYSFLFKTVNYQISPDVKRIKAFWGLLADAEWNSKDYQIEGLLYLAAIKRNGENFHSRILPLWYYESDKNSHTLFIPPALTWDSKESDGSKFQLWLAGLLWYRNYNPEEKSDFQLALLGIPYYKTQKPERGYQSKGSLWGGLWEYETEDETNYSKFSLIKGFIYKRVVMDGEVTHKFFGISF